MAKWQKIAIFVSVLIMLILVLAIFTINSPLLIYILPFKVELPATNQLLPARAIDDLKKGNFRIVDESDNPKSNQATLFVTGPEPFYNLNAGERRAKAREIVNKVVTSKADVFAYTSNIDGYFSSAEGRRKAEELGRKNILRAVIFDGGHHLPGLNANPDLILCPVMVKDGRKVIPHAFIRDAVVLEYLKDAVTKSALDCSIVTFTRFVRVKTKNAMGLIAREALLAEAKRPRRERGREQVSFVYLEPSGQLELKAGMHYAAINFGDSGLPSLENLPIAKFEKERTRLERARRVKVISLPYSAWDLITLKL